MPYPHAGAYGSDNFLLSSGVPVAEGTPVFVYEIGTTTLATLYADRDRNPAANPTVTGLLGNVRFYAEPNDYEVVCAGGTIIVTVTPDPDDTDFVVGPAGTTNLDGGTPTSTYGAVAPVDGGTP